MAYTRIQFIPFLFVFSVFSALSLDVAEAATQYELGYRRASEDPQNLTSPNYPGQYPSDASLIWWIYSNYMYSDIYIQVMYLDIENSSNCDNDNLTLYQYFGGFLEKVVGMCGNSTSRQKLSFDNDVIVIFETNTNTEGNGFVIQYYMEEHDDSGERDDYRSKGLSNNWGTAVIIICVLTAVVLAVAIAVACYCQRKQKQTQVEETTFSNAPVSFNTDKPSVAVVTDGHNKSVV